MLTLLAFFSSLYQYFQGQEVEGFISNSQMFHIQSTNVDIWKYEYI